MHTQFTTSKIGDEMQEPWATCDERASARHRIQSCLESELGWILSGVRVQASRFRRVHK
jgi:hypothetical protein